VGGKKLSLTTKKRKERGLTSVQLSLEKLEPKLSRGSIGKMYIRLKEILRKEKGRSGKGGEIEKYRKKNT